MLAQIESALKHFINLIPSKRIAIFNLKFKSIFYNSNYRKLTIYRVTDLPGKLFGGKNA